MYIRHFADPIYKAILLCLTVYWSSSSASEFYTINFFAFEFVWVMYTKIFVFLFSQHWSLFPPKLRKKSPFLPPPSCKHLIPVIKCLSILPQIPSCSPLNGIPLYEALWLCSLLSQNSPCPGTSASPSRTYWGPQGTAACFWLAAYAARWSCLCTFQCEVIFLD